MISGSKITDELHYDKNKLGSTGKLRMYTPKSLQKAILIEPHNPLAGLRNKNL